MTSFVPLVVLPADHSGSALYVHVIGSSVWLEPAVADPEWTAHLVGIVGGQAWWAVDVPDGHDPSDGAALDLRSYFGRASENEWLAAGRAVQIVEWARTHRFCGRCGEPTELAARRARDAVSGVRAHGVPAPGAGDDHARHTWRTTDPTRKRFSPVACNGRCRCSRAWQGSSSPASRSNRRSCARCTRRSV